MIRGTAYTSRVYTIHEFAVEIPGEDPSQAEIFVAMLQTVLALCKEHSLSTEDLDTVHWNVRAWPTYSDPEHIVFAVRVRDIFTDHNL